MFSVNNNGLQAVGAPIDTAVASPKKTQLQSLMQRMQQLYDTLDTQSQQEAALQLLGESITKMQQMQPSKAAVTHMPQPKISVHVPADLVGLVGRYLPLEEAHVVQDVARFQTAAAMVEEVARTFNGATVNAQSLQHSVKLSYEGKEKECLIRVIKDWFFERKGPFQLPAFLHNSTALSDLAFLQPLMKEMSAEELDIVMKELVEKLPSITTLDFKETQAAPETIKRLQSLPKLSTLTVSSHFSGPHFLEIGALQHLKNLSFADHWQVTDAHIEILCMQCPNLESLDLKSCRSLTPAVLDSVKTLSKLHTLSFERCEHIPADKLLLLRELPSLRSLNVAYCLLGDAEYAALGMLTSLIALDLSYSTVLLDNSEVRMSHIGCLSNLRTLKLRGHIGLSDAALEQCSRLTQLQHLDLCMCDRFTEEGLKHLAALTQLQTLDLACTNAALGLKYLVALTHLHTLKLQQVKLTDESLASCALFPALQDLDLAFNNDITAAGVASLAPLKNLRRLCLGGCSGIREDVFATLAQLPCLLDLSLRGVNCFTDESATHIAKLQTLQKLDLDYTNITDEYAQGLAGCTALQTLSLAGTGISDAALSSLSGHLSLEELDLSHCRKIVGTGLTHVATCKALKKLNLADCGKLQNAALQRLCENRTLLSLDLQNCRRIGDIGISYVAQIATLEQLDVVNCPLSGDAFAHFKKMARLSELDMSTALEDEYAEERQEFERQRPHVRVTLAS